MIILIIMLVSDEKGRRILLIACLLPFIVVLLVLSSPMAIFFAVTDEQDSSQSVTVIMNELRLNFDEKIELEQSDSSADEIHTIVMGSEDGDLIDNSEDVLIKYFFLFL